MGLSFKEKMKIFVGKCAQKVDPKHFKPIGFDKRKLLEILPVEPVIFDIGANDGTDSIQFRKLFPKAIIHAFEPEPSNFKKLIRRTKGLGIQCHNIAFGTTDGKARFFVSSGTSTAASSSLRKPTGHLTLMPHIEFNDIIEVNVRRLESWAQENSINRVDFLWLDTQGTELDILKNSGTVLQIVKAIHTEVSLVELYEGSPLYPEVKEFLLKNNFSVLEEIFYPESVGDVLFVKKDVDST